MLEPTLNWVSLHQVSRAQRSSSTVQPTSKRERERQGNVTLLAANPLTPPQPTC